MKIGIFSDTHYCNIETLEQNRKPKRAYDCVKAALDDFCKNEVELVVCLGDLIHYNEGIEVSKKYLEKISSLINSYKIDCVICLGNHDNEVFNHEDYERISGLKVAPMIIEKEKVKLIFLDASYTLDGKIYNQGELDWTVSFIPKQQIEWLDKHLETDKDCIVFVHQNIDINVEEHHIVSNANEVNDILKNHKNVKHVYQGHYHFGAENIINKIPYTTMRAMCIGDENNYKIIEV